MLFRPFVKMTVTCNEFQPSSIIHNWTTVGKGPTSRDVKYFKVKVVRWLNQHTESIRGESHSKPNRFFNLCKLTEGNLSGFLCKSEMAPVRYLMTLGYQIYSIASNEDAQWCDIVCWSKRGRRWILIELKCNHDDPLFNSQGQFARLGTIGSVHSMLQYFRKGVRLNSIAQNLGFGGIILIYEGKLRPGYEKGLYNITYAESGIRNVTKINNDNFEKVISCY